MSPTRRGRSACLEAVTTVDYDEVHRLTGEDETLEPDDEMIKQVRKEIIEKATKNVNKLLLGEETCDVSV